MRTNNIQTSSTVSKEAEQISQDLQITIDPDSEAGYLEFEKKYIDTNPEIRGEFDQCKKAAEESLSNPHADVDSQSINLAYSIADFRIKIFEHYQAWTQYETTADWYSLRGEIGAIDIRKLQITHMDENIENILKDFNKALDLYAAGEKFHQEDSAYKDNENADYTFSEGKINTLFNLLKGLSKFIEEYLANNNLAKATHYSELAIQKLQLLKNEISKAKPIFAELDHKKKSSQSAKKSRKKKKGSIVAKEKSSPVDSFEKKFAAIDAEIKKLATKIQEKNQNDLTAQESFHEDEDMLGGYEAFSENNHNSLESVQTQAPSIASASADALPAPQQEVLPGFQELIANIPAEVPIPPPMNRLPSYSTLFTSVRERNTSYVPPIMEMDRNYDGVIGLPSVHTLLRQPLPQPNLPPLKNIPSNPSEFRPDSLENSLESARKKRRLS